MASRRQTAFEVQGLRQSRWLIDVVAQDAQTAREQATILLGRRGVDAVRVVREMTNVDLAISSSCIIFERFKPGQSASGPGANGHSRNDSPDDDQPAEDLLLDHAFWRPVVSPRDDESFAAQQPAALASASPSAADRPLSRPIDSAVTLIRDWAGRISIGLAVLALSAIVMIRLTAML